MSSQQPYLSTNIGERRRLFACSAVAVLVFIVDESEQVLLLAHPRRQGMWEVVNGSLEAEETLLAAALRETREEVGPDVRVRPLGVVHAYTFHFDENVPYMLSLGYLMAYEGGAIQPGDDMRGSRFRWWGLEEIAEASVQIIVPPNQKWLMKRAVELYRLWKEQTVELQPELSFTAKNKYALSADPETERAASHPS